MPHSPNATTRLVNWFIPANAGWGELELRRAQLFVTGYIFGPLFAYLLALVLQRAEDPLSIAYWGFIAIATGLFAFPIALRLTGAYNVVSVVATLYSTAMIFFMVYNYGGWISPALPTTVIVPVAAFFFLNTRGRTFCLGALAAGFLALIGLHFTGHVFPMRVAPEALADLFMLSVFVTGAYVALLTGTLVNLFNASEGMLHEEIEKHQATGRQLQQAKEDSDHANRAKSEFLANMSHELRTPLNAIIGFSEMMASETLGPLGSPQYESYARDIQSSGRHLLDLVADILDLAKIESGKDEPQESLVDISRLFESIIPLVSGRASDGGVTLKTHIADGLPGLHGDSRKLKQILVNLLSNGIKFTKPGGTVRLSATLRDDDGMTLQVADTGIGMAAQDIPAALSQFGQVENSMGRKHEGTGIGLPLSKALTEQHGGFLTLETVLGAGTTVSANFPAERTAHGPEDESVRALRQSANPSEMRRIVFTQHEVLVALSRYTAKPNGGGGTAQYLACRVLRTPKLRVLAELRPDAGGAVQEIEFEASEIADALLRYCSASGVPIPKRADKELEAVGENLALNLRIEMAAEPLHRQVTAKPR